jgi:hypothetical protein
MQEIVSAAERKKEQHKFCNNAITNILKQKPMTKTTIGFIRLQNMFVQQSKQAYTKYTGHKTLYLPRAHINPQTYQTPWTLWQIFLHVPP